MNQPNHYAPWCTMVHHGAPWCTMVHQNPSTHRAGGTRTRAHCMGERALRCVAWVYPRAFFFPDPADSIPPVYEGGGRRGNNINNTMASCRGPPPTIVPRGLPLIRSGGIPLSLITCIPSFLAIRQGRPQPTDMSLIYPLHIPNISLIYPF